MLAVTALLTAISGCSSGTLSAGPADELAIFPAAPEVAPGDKLQFAVVPSSVESVSWFVEEPEGGTIDPAGWYTAPDSEGTFTVTAAIAAAKSANRVHVTRKPFLPTITSFKATPSTIEQGGSTTLSWSVLRATSIQIDNDVGTVTGDSVSVTPSETVTYTLTASNRAGSVTAKVAVTVTAPSPNPVPAPSQGTGTSYGPSFLTGVTGGGAMPAWSTNVVTASCAGDGVTDDTACLQAAASSARSRNVPLVIPARSSFYKITGPITVYTSVGGIGGMPTIRQTNTSATFGVQKIFVLAPGMTGWIYNLHLVGTFDGSNAVTEFGNQIDVGTVNGVTIKGNLLENAMGDSIGTDVSAFDGGTVSQNVIIDGNTMRNPYRCGVAFAYNQQNWVITNNVIEKPVNYVSGIDIEPEKAGVVLHVEIAYNKFVMNNRTVNPSRGADGAAVFGWHVPDPPTPTAGGDYYIHHNYGTFGTGFSGFGNGGWGYIYQQSNVEGPAVPTS